MKDFFIPASQQHIKKQRQKASELKKTLWWRKKLQKGQCYYCEREFLPKALSMDHLIPLVRGGLSIKNNLVPACKKCNFEKKHKGLMEIRHLKKTKELRKMGEGTVF